MKINASNFIPFILILLFAHSCSPQNSEKDIEKWKSEIIESEKAFSKMVSEQGIAEGFLAFAAENAVLLRSNKLTIGKQALRERYKGREPGPGNSQLSWIPDYVDVSRSGDLAYTYGKYTMITTDSTGKEKFSDGIFHTVWKRQSDGSWKFVWD